MTVFTDRTNILVNTPSHLLSETRFDTKQSTNEDNRAGTDSTDVADGATVTFLGTRVAIGSCHSHRTDCHQQRRFRSTWSFHRAELDLTTPYPVPEVNTIQETAEQDKTAVVTKVNQTLMNAILTREPVRKTQPYNGVAVWIADDMSSNICANMYQLLARWLCKYAYCWACTFAQAFISFSLIVGITVDSIRFILARTSHRRGLSGLNFMIKGTHLSRDWKSSQPAQTIIRTRQSARSIVELRSL